MKVKRELFLAAGEGGGRGGRVMELATWQKWQPLLRSLYDGEHFTGRPLPGADVGEWMLLVQCDYDEVDREHYLETVGGA